MAKEVKWSSPPPETCDICGNKIKDVFIDGRTSFGAWACMCPSCHFTQGYGLGTGRGQKYQKKNGGWIKVAG